MDILAPVVRGQKGEFRDVLERLRKEGYLPLRHRRRGQLRTPSAIRLEKNKKHTIEVIVDTIEPGAEPRGSPRPPPWPATSPTGS